MTALDPVTLAILKGRLEQIADEMDATLYRSAFNPIIAEARDACHGIYHAASGATLVQGTKGLPIFVGAMAGSPPATPSSSTILTPAVRISTISGSCGRSSAAIRCSAGSPPPAIGWT